MSVPVALDKRTDISLPIIGHIRFGWQVDAQGNMTGDGINKNPPKSTRASETLVFTSANKEAMTALKKLLGGTAGKYDHDTETYRLISDSSVVSVAVDVRDDHPTRYELRSTNGKRGRESRSWRSRLCNGEVCEYQATDSSEVEQVPCVCAKEIVELGKPMECKKRFRLRLMIPQTPTGVWLVDSGAETSEEGINGAYQTLKAFTALGLPRAEFSVQIVQGSRGRRFPKMILTPMGTIEELQEAYASQAQALSAGEHSSLVRQALLPAGESSVFDAGSPGAPPEVSAGVTVSEEEIEDSEIEDAELVEDEN